MTWRDRLRGLLDDCSAFNSWRRQPSTVAGFSVAGGTLSALAASQITERQAVGLLIAALIAMIFPDNADRKVSAVPAAVAADTISSSSK